MNEISIRLAVVEDREDIRIALVQLLNADDELACIADFADGESALEHIPDLGLDLVLMDLGLPGMSGIACIAALKKKCPELQFMVCSIYDEDEKVFEALAAGAHGYLLKGMEVDVLIRSIKELHAGGSPMSADIARKVVSAFHKKHTRTESYGLTPREIEILQQLAKGLSYQQIADALFISDKTLKKHVYNIYGKLHVHSRTEALNKYFGKYE